MTTDKAATLSWRREVKSLLRQGALTVADLADELGVNRATVHRYLDGDHRPKPETIRRVNDAVATVIAPAMRLDRMPDDPGDKGKRARNDIADYLAAVALFEFGDRDDAAELGLRLGLRFVASYIEQSAVEQIEEALDKQTQRQRSQKIPRRKWSVTTFGLTLLVELRRIAVDIARAQYATLSRFDRIAALFEGQDASLKGLVKPRREVLHILVYERFHAKVAAAIARQIKDRDERLILHDGIERATRDLIEELNELLLPNLSKIGEK